MITTSGITPLGKDEAWKLVAIRVQRNQKKQKTWSFPGSSVVSIGSFYKNNANFPAVTFNAGGFNGSRSFKTIIFLAVVFLACLKNYADGEITPKPYTPSGGGGECDTDLDCSSQGRCAEDESANQSSSEEDDDEGNSGKCICNTGRDGKNCEKEDKKSRKRTIFGLGKELKRELTFATDLAATGLDPAELAANDMSFLIYNPRSERYVRATETRRVPGSQWGNKYLDADFDYRGAGKLFKLKSLGGGKYNIIGMDDDGAEETGYVYVSDTTTGVVKKSRRLMKSETSKDEEPYKFQFLKHSMQNGIYKIKSDGVTLFQGIKGHKIKADNRGDRAKSEEIWFEFNLPAKMSLKTTVTDTRQDALAQGDDLEVDHEEYDNNHDADKTVTLNKVTTKSKVLTKLEKTGVSGTAGVKANIGNIGITANHERSTTDQTTKTDVTTKDIILTIKAKTKVCVEYTYRFRSRFDEQTLEITDTSKPSMKLIGHKLIAPQTSGDITMKIRDVPVGTSCV
eukprot:gene876-172_t